MQDLERLAMAENNPPEVAGIKKPIVMPDIFKGDVDEDWEEYLEHFESCADINGWDDPTKCKFVSVKLKGNAYKVYKELDTEVKSDWANLCSTLEKRFKTVTQTQHYKTKFLSTAKSRGESLLDLGNRIRSLGRKAYPNLEAKLRDELARDQFVRSLDNLEMTLKIRHQMPETLDDAIRMAIDWQTVEQDVRKVQDSVKTSEPNEACCAGMQHPDSQLHNMMKEMLTLMKEDRDYSRRGGQPRWQQDSTRKPRCYTCGSDKHFKRDCPDGPRCWNCNKVGHTQRNCPLPAKPTSGNGD